MPTASAKICITCRKDCSALPRTKDQQGRYSCMDCFKATQKRAAAPASPPPPPPEPSYDVAPEPEQVNVMAALLDAPAAMPSAANTIKSCPACSAIMRPGTAVCMACGYNSATGKVMRVKFSKEKGPRKGLGINISGTAFAAIWFGVLAALFALGWAFPPMAIVYLGAFGVAWIIYLILLVVTPFREGNTAWGILNLVTAVLLFAGVGVLPGLGTLYYLFAICERASLKVMFFVQLIGGVGAYFLLIALNDGVRPF